MERTDLKRLNIGAGADIRDGWINHDFKRKKGTDVTHDLNVYPWPWKDSSMDEITMYHVLEHLQDPIRAMNEAVRILRGGGD